MIRKNPSRLPSPTEVQPWIKSIDFMGITKARIKTRGPILILIPLKGQDRRPNGKMRRKVGGARETKKAQAGVPSSGLTCHRGLFCQQRPQAPHGFPHRPLSLPYFVQFEGKKVLYLRPIPAKGHSLAKGRGLQQHLLV
jgi:hypothetical protein